MRPAPDLLPDLVDAKTLADYCGVSETTARRWFRQAAFPRRKLGRKWFAARGAILVALCRDAEFEANLPRFTVLQGQRPSPESDAGHPSTTRAARVRRQARETCNHSPS